MPLDAAGYQDLLTLEIDFDPTANPALSGMISTLWTKNDDRAFDLTLQYLYTKADIIRWLLQSNWNRFDWIRGDVSKDHSDIFKQLKLLLDTVKEDIRLLEAGISGNLSPATSVIRAGTRSDPTAYIRANPYLQWFRFTHPLLDVY